MGIQITNYTFDASSKAITFTDYETVLPESILSIENSSTGQFVYLKGNTSQALTVADNVVTLNDSIDSTSMSDSDRLFIKYDDGNPYSNTNLITGLKNLLDSIATYPATGKIMDKNLSGELVELTVKRAPISVSTSGATTIVAAVALKKIRPISIVLVANDFVNIKFQSHTTPTDLTGLLYLGSNGGFASGLNEHGHFETVAGEALDINLSASIAVGGWINYVEA